VRRKMDSISIGVLKKLRHTKAEGRMKQPVDQAEQKHS